MSAATATAPAVPALVAVDEPDTAAGEISTALAAVVSPRFAVLQLLSARPGMICREIADALGMSRSGVLKYLGELERAGLVVGDAVLGERRGRQVRYAVRDGAVLQVVGEIADAIVPRGLEVLVGARRDSRPPHRPRSADARHAGAGADRRGSGVAWASSRT
ncbi:helix-turn-helix transcriptional regulator [Cellulomonas sp. C5510]|uniref:ArsR/SmtB family transcription factor n=1 Tax=Cellulomonas sp. C5510 TaxID=2871170 RepID=UPI001C93A3D4|nr:helix-turn-helix domain-containing protein [Cellulomonas sp. C5510]QZN85339.1 helix-turn-helix domain-containing protein [Cellulomonas sp. C5510]